MLRIAKDILKPVKWPIAKEMHSEKLEEYYFLFKEEAMVNQKGGQKSIVYDGSGIPMNSTYIDVKDKDFVYFPITIGQVGLAVFHTWLTTQSEKDKKRFLKFADWFAQNSHLDPKIGALWYTDVALPQYQNPGPWQSAFVQSRAISVLLRAYQLTDKIKYKELAEHALKPFLFSVAEGGVTSFTEFGPFYEEYTAKEPTLVLNGMVFALCGVADFTRIFPDHKEAKRILNEGLSALEKILPKFDLGYWSKYNLCQAKWYPDIDPATVTYQHLHITQLEMLFQFTGNKTFEKYRDKFKKQLHLLNIIRMYLTKYKALKKLGRL